jgi:hypothetical protein
MILAAGCMLVFTIFSGVTTNVLTPGGTAMLHFNSAPLQTCSGMSRSPVAGQ